MNQETFKTEMLDKFPQWAQLFLACLVLGGGMLATYVANEVGRASVQEQVARHTQEIAEIKSSVREVPVLSERVYQLYNQNERQLVVFERLATSVDKLSTNVARLDERMKALEKGD